MNVARSSLAAVRRALRGAFSKEDSLRSVTDDATSIQIAPA
jgi:hypothetical protein